VQVQTAGACHGGNCLLGCLFVQLHTALAAMEVGKRLLEMQRDEALAHQAELQSQLLDIGVEIEGHVQEAEQERRRSQMEADSKEASGECYCQRPGLSSGQVSMCSPVS